MSDNAFSTKTFLLTTCQLCLGEHAVHVVAVIHDRCDPLNNWPILLTWSKTRFNKRFANKLLLRFFKHFLTVFWTVCILGISYTGSEQHSATDTGSISETMKHANVYSFRNLHIARKHIRDIIASYHTTHTYKCMLDYLLLRAKKKVTRNIGNFAFWYFCHNE